MTQKNPFIREVKEYSVISTQGDFATTSRVFVRVPGTVLPLTVEEAKSFHVAISLNVSGDPCAVGLLVDGQLLVSGRVCEEPRLLDRVGIFITTIVTLGPGEHVLEIQAHAIEGVLDIPEGPREWSPRKNKRPPRISILHADPSSPTVLRLIG